MGTTLSKSNEDHTFLRQESVQKSSKTRRLSVTKIEQIENISKVAGNLKNEIDIFLGNRNSSRYKEFQKILATLAAELQQIKNGTKKQQQRDRCDEVQGQIQNCLQRLETKVNFNEQNGDLDLASVESHSFIRAQTQLSQEKPTDTLVDVNVNLSKSKQANLESTKSLDNIEQETHILERDIKNSIELEDVKQFIIYESKIKILYRDLEMIKVDEHTPLCEKKATIGKRLIRCNNQIKRFRRNNEKKSQASVKSITLRSKSEESELNKTDRALADLEIQALTFEGTKGDKRYKELEQILESHWTTVYSLDLIEDEERNRRALMIERIKNILQELRKRAEENEKQAKSIKSIHKIDQQVQSLKKEVENFHGIPKDPSYIKLDQELRNLWGRLGEVEEPNEHVRRNKARVISEVQHVLKDLAQASQTRESQINEDSSKLTKIEGQVDEDDILQKQLVKQVEEFQNHWNQLNYNLEVPKITKTEHAMVIIETLGKILESIQQKQSSLSIIEKRKSTGSLVTAKLVNAPDKLTTVPVSITTYQSYYQPPDLLQQQTNHTVSTKGIDDGIKVQPVVKTIGEMQRVGTEAKNLLQQIRQSNCIKNDSEYKMFETRLQQCRTNLDNIEYNKRSDTLESNRRRASKIINEAFRALEDKMPSKQEAIRSSKAQDFMDIDAEIQYLRQQIRNFLGVVKDKHYEKIKQGLSDCLNKLQIIDDVQISKQDSIRQIQQYHQELETKLAENQAKVKISEQNSEIRRQTSQDIKAIVEQVQKLKLQIERFSGVHDGIYYKQVEGNLKSCMEKLDAIDARGDEKLQNAIEQTRQKVQKYLRVLEDKSSKPVEPEPHKEHVVEETVVPQKESSVSVKSKLQRQSQIDPDSPHHKINTLRDKLVVIKDETETFSGKYKDEDFKRIEKELMNCFDELKGINDRGHKSVIISKDQYADYIEKLMQYFEDKARLQDEITQNVQVQVKQSTLNYKIGDPTEELSVIEEQIEKIKKRIDDFSGTLEDDDYKNLSHDVTDHIIKLDNVQAGNVAHVREMKRKLILEFQNCRRLLEDKVKSQPETSLSSQEEEQLNVINGVLKELEQVAKEVNDFNGVKNDDKYCYLDELLIRLTIKLDNTATYGKADLRNARKKVIHEIHKNMKILSQKVAENEESSEYGVQV